MEDQQTEPLIIRLCSVHGCRRIALRDRVLCRGHYQVDYRRRFFRAYTDFPNATMEHNEIQTDADGWLGRAMSRRWQSVLEDVLEDFWLWTQRHS